MHLTNNLNELVISDIMKNILKLRNLIARERYGYFSLFSNSQRRIVILEKIISEFVPTLNMLNMDERAEIQQKARSLDAIMMNVFSVYGGRHIYNDLGKKVGIGMMVAIVGDGIIAGVMGGLIHYNIISSEFFTDYLAETIGIGVGALFFSFAAALGTAFGYHYIVNARKITYQAVANAIFIVYDTEKRQYSPLYPVDQNMTIQEIGKERRIVQVSPEDEETELKQQIIENDVMININPTQALDLYSFTPPSTCCF